MSLINTMLRNLDARQSTDAVADVPHGVALLAEPEAPKSNRRSVHLALGGFVIVLLVLLTSEAWLPGVENWLWPSVDEATVENRVTSPASNKPQMSGMASSESLDTSSPDPVANTATPLNEQRPSLVVAGATLASGAVLPEHSSLWRRLSNNMILPSTKQSPREASGVEKHSAERAPPAYGGGLKLDMSLSKAMDQLVAAPSVIPGVMPAGSIMAAEPGKLEVVKTLPNAKSTLGANVSSGAVHKTVRNSSHIMGNEAAEEAYRKGASAYKQGKMTEAATQLQAALQEAPGHAAARQTLLSLYVGQKRYDEAQTLLKDGLALLPEQTGWAMASARIHVERGNTVAAWDILQRHLEYAGNNADYHGFVGVILQRLNKPREAIGHYQHALELRPNEGRWWFGLGSALDSDNRGADALEAYQRALTAGNLTTEMMAVIANRVK